MPRSKQDNSATGLQTIDQLHVSKALQDDSEVDIVDQAMRKAAFNANNRLGNDEATTSEGAPPPKAVVIMVNDVQVSLENVTFSMVGRRASNDDDVVMAEEGEGDPARATGGNVRPREKGDREDQKIWSLIMSGNLA